MKKKIGICIMFLSIVLGTVLIPTYSAYAQNQQAFVDTSDSNDYEGRLQTCGPTNMTACLVNAFYYLVLTPSAWFARITGELFDYFVQYSLDTNSYKGGNDNFIERGWSIVRDIGNVLFIFALLYIAITHILQAGSSGTKKLLINLIIAALLINFSLFFSRIIIDAGNILARAFYNNIEIPNDDNIQYHTISQGIVMHVNPQRILGSDLFKPKHSNLEVEVESAKLDNGYAFTILAVSAAVNITLGITFLSVALLFVGRVVGLWFLMIFSPFALASIAVPNGKNVFKGLSWSSWLDQVMNLSFMAPVFLFFLFLLIMFLQVIFQTNISSADQTTVQKLMAIIIPFAMVIFILNKAKSVAADMAGEAGSAVKSIFGKAANFGLGAAGLAGGAALGVTAFAGRQVIGRAASAALDNKYFQNRVRTNILRATTSERKAKQATNATDRAQHLRDASNARAAAARNAIAVKQLGGLKKSSFDIRRSDTLQKQILGSKLAKTTIGSGGYTQALGSQFFDDKTKLKFGMGKGTDASIGKAKGDESKAAKKELLTTGQLYGKDTIKDPSNETLEDIKNAANKGFDSRDEVLGHIDKYLKEIRDSEFLTDSEKIERAEAAEAWRDIAKSAVDDGGMRTINIGSGNVEYTNEKGERDVMSVDFNSPGDIKTSEISSKDAYAELKKSSMKGLSDKEKEDLVASIRKGDKPRDDKDELLQKVAKYAKDDDHGKDDKKKDDHKKDEHKEEKHEAPKSPPSSPPPSGGGGGHGPDPHHP